MAYLHWATCHNLNHSNMWIELPRLFHYYYYSLNIGTRGNTSFAPNNDQNSCILIACDNTYTMESKDELIFVDFFVHPSCCLQLISHVTCPKWLKDFSCKCCLQLKFNCKDQSKIGVFLLVIVNRVWPKLVIEKKIVNYYEFVNMKAMAF
jgi:hypothetical protein